MEKAEEVKRAAFSSFRAMGVVIPPELEKALVAPLPAAGESPGESPADDSAPPENDPAMPAPQQLGPSHEQKEGISAPGRVATSGTASEHSPAPGVNDGLFSARGEEEPLAGKMRQESDRAAPQQFVTQGAGGGSIAQGTGRNEAAQPETGKHQPDAAIPKAEPVVKRASSMYSSAAWQTVPVSPGSLRAASGVPGAEQQPGHCGQKGVNGPTGQAGPTGRPGSSSHTTQRGHTGQTGPTGHSGCSDLAAQRGNAGQTGYTEQPPRGADQNLRLVQAQSRHEEPPAKKPRVEGPSQPGADVAAQVVRRYAHTHQLAASSPRLSATEFAGQDVLRPEPQRDAKVLRQGAARHRGSEGPVDVDRMPGGFDAFMELWAAREEYAIDFHAGKEREAEGGVWAWELEGMAVCWKDSAVYYVSIKTTPPAGPQHSRHQGPPGTGKGSSWGSAVRARWGRVLDRLCFGRGKAIVWHLQHWLKVLAQAYVLAPSSGKAPAKPAPAEGATLLSRFLAGEDNVGVKLVSVRGSLPSGQMQLAHGGKGPAPGQKIDLKQMALTGDAHGGAEGVVLSGLPGPWRVVDTKLLVWILDPVEGDRTLEKVCGPLPSSTP